MLAMTFSKYAIAFFDPSWLTCTPLSRIGRRQLSLVCRSTQLRVSPQTTQVLTERVVRRLVTPLGQVHLTQCLPGIAEALIQLDGLLE